MQSTALGCRVLSTHPHRRPRAGIPSDQVISVAQLRLAHCRSFRAEKRVAAQRLFESRTSRGSVVTTSLPSSLQPQHSQSQFETDGLKNDEKLSVFFTFAGFSAVDSDERGGKGKGRIKIVSEAAHRRDLRGYGRPGV